MLLGQLFLHNNMSFGDSLVLIMLNFSSEYYNSESCSDTGNSPEATPTYLLASCINFKVLCSLSQ